MTVDSMAIHFLPQAQSEISLQAAYPSARFRGFSRRRTPHFLILLGRPSPLRLPFANPPSGRRGKFTMRLPEQGQIRT
jgi:hypothetical protein